jgi:hypothetical protein
MTDERGSFLSRWSKRKLEERQPQAQDERTGRNPEAEQPLAAEPEPALTPEQIEALPKIEDLTPESDLSVFWRKGVPALLRKAALRRMWSLDPAIRDYVGDARDYGYDWNIPGDVPGNGPLLPTDDVEGMLRQVFGHDREAETVQAPNLRPETSQASDRKSLPEADGPDHAVQQGLETDPVPAEEENPFGQPVPVAGTEPDPRAPPSPAAAVAKYRRHGRAKPV